MISPDSEINSKKLETMMIKYRASLDQHHETNTFSKSSTFSFSEQWFSVITFFSLAKFFSFFSDRLIVSLFLCLEKIFYVGRGCFHFFPFLRLVIRRIEMTSRKKVLDHMSGRGTTFPFLLCIRHKQCNWFC